MNLYSQNDSAQLVKPNPFKKKIPRNLKIRSDTELLLYIEQKAKLKTDFRNRIKGTFRYSLKRLKLNPLNKEFFYFYTPDKRYEKIKTFYRSPKSIVHQRSVHQGRIWQVKVDQANYNLLYFYNQIGRTTTGKKTNLRKKLDKITKILIYKTYFYEHLINEISTFEKVYPFQKPSMKIFYKKKDYFESLHILERIINKDALFLKKKISNRRVIYPLMALYFYNYLLHSAKLKIFYELDWFFLINTGRLNKFHQDIKQSYYRRFLIFYRDEKNVNFTKLRCYPPRRFFKFDKTYITNLRNLVNELYDVNGIIHIEAINALFNGHLKNKQIVSYFKIHPYKSRQRHHAFYERILKEIIYGYNIDQNKIYNVSVRRLSNASLLFERYNSYLRSTYRFTRFYNNYVHYNPRKNMMYPHFYEQKVMYMKQVTYKKIKFLKKLRRYTLYEQKKFE